jgi:hypothetical protein
MPFSKPKFPNFTELSLTQETERLAIVISESGRRKKDMKAAGLKALESKTTERKKSQEIFPLLKSRPKGRCKA